jgi:hypothetical protein
VFLLFLLVLFWLLCVERKRKKTKTQTSKTSLPFLFQPTFTRPTSRFIFSSLAGPTSLLSPSYFFLSSLTSAGPSSPRPSSPPTFTLSLSPSG